MKHLKDLWPYLREHKLRIWVVCIGSVLFAILRLVDPYIYKLTVDDVLVKLSRLEIDLHRALELMTLSCVIFFGAKILTSLIYAFYTYFSLVVYFAIERKMYCESNRHIQSLDLSFHHSQNSGNLRRRVERGIASVTKILHEDISRVILPNGINIALLLSIMAVWNWQLTLAATIFLPIHIIFSLHRALPMKREQVLINKLDEVLSHRVQEIMSNIEAVISFNASQRELEEFEKGRMEMNVHQLNTARVWRVISFSASFFEGLGKCATLLVGTWLVALGVKGEGLTPGDVVMFWACVGMLYSPLLDMVVSCLRVRQELPKVERFTELMDIKPKIADLPGAISMPPLRHSIILHDLSFDYAEGNEILTDINLTIPAGKKVAIVGPSGAGKSTLANIIQRFFDPTAGMVSVDGTDLRKLKLESIHRQITIVSQHPWLFSRPIKENIAYGRPEASDVEIESAAIAANAHEFIIERSEGYNTLIGEDGVLLSGGEQQRVSIARAILCDASVIIMDEATSHLDSVSEAQVQEAIWRLTKNKTVIIIAHRLSTVIGADMIVVMNKGAVVDSGTHDELLGRCELYQELHNRQFKDE